MRPVSRERFNQAQQEFLNVGTGTKFDEGKPPLSWISKLANEEEARVLAFGAKKYARWNWANGMAWSRVLDAAMRHLAAFADGENLDPETGLSHLAHARCCTGFLLDYLKEHPELDDRRKRLKPEPEKTIPVSQSEMKQIKHFGKTIQDILDARKV